MVYSSTRADFFSVAAFGSSLIFFAPLRLCAVAGNLTNRQEVPARRKGFFLKGSDLTASEVKRDVVLTLTTLQVIVTQAAIQRR